MIYMNGLPVSPTTVYLLESNAHVFQLLMVFLSYAETCTCLEFCSHTSQNQPGWKFMTCTPVKEWILSLAFL